MELILRAGCWKIFVPSWQKLHAPIINTICSIALLIDKYNDRLLPLLRQFFLIPNRNNKLTRDTHLMQQFIYYYKQLYMFRASVCPSSGILGCIRILLLHMVFSTLNENCALVGCLNGCMCIVQV